MKYNFKTKLEPLARGFLNCESEYKGKRIAAGWRLAQAECPISFNRDYLPLAFRQGIAITFDYGDGVYCEDEIFDQIVAQNPDDADELKEIRKLIDPYLVYSYVFKNLWTEQQRQASVGWLWGGGWLGHAVPALWDVCKYGTASLREKIEKYREINAGNDDFYDSLTYMVDAIDLLGARFYNLAQEQLQTCTDPEAIEKLENVKRTFDHAPQQPCRDFVEACIVYVMMMSLDGIDSPGHFDQYMYDFWKVTDPEQREKYLNYIWQYFEDTRTWNLCLSGSDENGNDLTNDLTYAILGMIRKYRYEAPNVTLRWHKNTPEELMKVVHQTLAAGTGLPGLYNDEVVCTAMERLGISKKDAHTYVMNGCNQIDIPGKSHQGLEDGEVSIGKVLELTLHNGISATTGSDNGLHTGDPVNFATFEEFYDAFIQQLDYAVDTATYLSNLHQSFDAKHAQNPLRSLFIEGCIEKALDYKDRGPIYGNGQILAETIADAIDSLAAIKKYVYEEKRYTMAELIDALNKNFEGYDEMYQFLKNSPLKFGNDIEYVDTIAGDVINHFNTRLLSIETFRGGHFSGGCSPFMRAADWGFHLGALPNGKKKGETLAADSIGATPGFDKNGPTAVINSCLHFDHTLPGSGFVLNLKFDKDIFVSSAGENTFLSLWRSYFERGGQMMTATVVSPDELIDAQAHPENHANLIVRVGGFSGKFVDLPKELQDNVIARTLHCHA